jgi:hypothetical protein
LEQKAEVDSSQLTVREKEKERLGVKLLARAHALRFQGRNEEFNAEITGDAEATKKSEKRNSRNEGISRKNLRKMRANERKR